MSRNRAQHSAVPASSTALARGPVLATVFTTGACVLVVEIAGARVVSPLYGSGLYSWSALISVTLAALSLGYWAGGRAVDRRPEPELFHGIIGLAGLLVLAIPVLAGPVLRLTEPFDPRFGVLLASVKLFFLPLALLGGVTPFAIRLATPPQGEVGAVSGMVFAVSTLGSLLAALATGFVLIPNLGLRTILSLSGAVLLLTSALGFLLTRRRVAGALAILASLLGLLGARERTTGVSSSAVRIVASVPSFYGQLRVVEAAGYRIMTVNGIGQNYVSLTPNGFVYPYLEFMASMPRLRAGGPSRPKGLLIGLGAGQLVAMLDSAGVQLAVVEIDPRVEQLARSHFGLEHPRAQIHIEDGRAFVERDREAYDIVFMDAFLGEDVPGHLYTREALQAVHRRLAPGGLLAMNYTTITGGRDAGALARTLREVFPHVHAFTDGTEGGELASMVLVASDRELGFDASRAAGSSGAELFLSHEIELPSAGSGVLTDDHNPINTHRLGANRAWRRIMANYIGGDRDYWTTL